MYWWTFGHLDRTASSAYLFFVLMFSRFLWGSWGEKSGRKEEPPPVSGRRFFRGLRSTRNWWSLI